MKQEKIYNLMGINKNNVEQRITDTKKMIFHAETIEEIMKLRLFIKNLNKCCNIK